MTQFLGVQTLASPWTVAGAIILSIVVIAFITRSLVIWIVRRTLARTPALIDDRICQLLEKYLWPILTVGGLLLFVDEIPLSVKALQLVNRFLAVVGLSLSLFLLTKGTLLVLRGMARHYEPLRNIESAIETFTKIVFIAVGGMIVLDSLGISLTPVVTTLGVGSLAVAIALQDTLGNFFAGLYVKADRPVKVGHYIRLESGQEGYVEQIGWRSTHIRALQNNIVVVPNSKLAQTTITNYHLPEKRMALQIPVAVSYDCDPQAVEDILVDEAKNAVGEVEGLLGDPEPFVRFIPGFGDFSMNFTLICQVREFVDQYWVQHELRKRIYKRLQREGMQEAIRPFNPWALSPSGKAMQQREDDGSENNGPRRQ
jgi:small-conductance mechanosensitive channel